ncbi:hypothetical protein KM043_011696 [Ampulex compressa]|nr:hypothetical protein KM043_011696 [Ampulex compressa]
MSPITTWSPRRPARIPRSSRVPSFRSLPAGSPREPPDQPALFQEPYHPLDQPRVAQEGAVRAIAPRATRIRPGKTWRTPRGGCRGAVPARNAISCLRKRPKRASSAKIPVQAALPPGSRPGLLAALLPFYSRNSNAVRRPGTDCLLDAIPYRGMRLDLA